MTWDQVLTLVGTLTGVFIPFIIAVVGVMRAQARSLEALVATAAMQTQIMKEHSHMLSDLSERTESIERFHLDSKNLCQLASPLERRSLIQDMKAG